MVVNARIQDLIRENRPDEITDAIDAGEYFEMQTFSQSLIDLVLRGEVEREVAANAATTGTTSSSPSSAPRRTSAPRSARPQRPRLPASRPPRAPRASRSPRSATASASASPVRRPSGVGRSVSDTGRLVKGEACRTPCRSSPSRSSPPGVSVRRNAGMGGVSAARPSLLQPVAAARGVAPAAGQLGAGCRVDRCSSDRSSADGTRGSTDIDEPAPADRGRRRRSSASAGLFERSRCTGGDGCSETRPGSDATPDRAGWATRTPPRLTCGEVATEPARLGVDATGV